MFSSPLSVIEHAGSQGPAAAWFVCAVAGRLEQFARFREANLP